VLVVCLEPDNPRGAVSSVCVCVCVCVSGNCCHSLTRCAGTYSSKERVVGQLSKKALVCVLICGNNLTGQILLLWAGSEGGWTSLGSIHIEDMIRRHARRRRLGKIVVRVSCKKSGSAHLHSRFRVGSRHLDGFKSSQRGTNIKLA
jgi:hypothetical protein